MTVLPFFAASTVLFSSRPWLATLAVVGISGVTAYAAPTNDYFANRATIVGNSASVTGSNLDATSESGEPNAYSPTNSVWWTWTASTAGVVTVDTFGSDFDTILGFYSGTSVESLSLLRENDEAGGTSQSEVKLQVDAGQILQIRVDGWSSNTGSVSLNLAFEEGAELDFVGPTISSASVTPVISNDGTGTIVVRLDFEDPSGFSYGSISFREANGRFISPYFDATKRVGGTSESGVYEVTIPVAFGSRPGLYSAAFNSFTDLAGNSSSASALVSGLSFTIDASVPEDNVGPVVSSASVTPSASNDGTGSVTLTLTITDASGFTFGDVSFLQEEGDFFYRFTVGADDRTGGTARDGTYAVTVPIRAGASAGTFSPTTTYHDTFNDEAANSTAAPDIAAIAALSFAVEQTIPTDQDGPEVIEASVTPTVANDGTGVVELTLRITDSLGFQSGYGYFGQAGGPGRYFDFDSTDRIGGTAQDGTYSISIPIRYGIPAGSYTFTSATLFDVGNHLSSNPALVAALGFTVEATVPDDVSAPLVTSASITPSVANDGSGVVELTVAISDAAGFSNGNVSFETSTGGELYFYIDSSDRVSGTAREGVYAVSRSIAAGYRVGTWTVDSLYLSDLASNFTNDSPLLAGLSFTVEETVPSDLEGPAIVEASITPSVANDGTETVSLTVRITDSVGFDYGQVNFTTASGGFQSFLSRT